MDVDPQWYKWCIIVIPMAIGLLSAGQTISTKHGPDFLETLKTGWGLSYWISRGIIPGGTYVAWSVANNTHSYWAAIACGFGSELILRAKLFVGQQKSEDATKSQDVYKGLFDLIEWWQGHFMAKAAVVLSEQRIKLVNDAVRNQTDFFDFAARVKRNVGAFSADQAEAIRQIVNKLLQSLRMELSQMAQGESSRDLHIRSIYELSHELLRLVGKRGFKSLTTGDPP